MIVIRHGSIPNLKTCVRSTFSFKNRPFVHELGESLNDRKIALRLVFATSGYILKCCCESQTPSYELDRNMRYLMIEIFDGGRPDLLGKFEGRCAERVPINDLSPI